MDLRLSRSPIAPIALVLLVAALMILPAASVTASPAPATVASAVVTSSSSPSAGPSSSAASTSGTASSEFQQAIQSLDDGQGPANGQSWNCEVATLAASECGPTSTPRVESSTAPSDYSYANYTDLNWSNLTGRFGGTFHVRDNGVATYDQAIQGVILFGGGGSAGYYSGCVWWGGGCASNATWIYQNGTWTNWTSYFEAYGDSPPPSLGATFTWDPEYGGDILTGGTVGFASSAANPYTWEFYHYTWYNITSEVGAGPDTVFGSAAYDGAWGGIVYVNGCANYFCNQTNVEGITWYLGAASDYKWENDTTGTPGPDGYSFGSMVAYDPTTQALVFYGGGWINTAYEYETTNDTWILSGSDFVWQNVSTTSDGYACYPGFGCFHTYPLASGFGAMTYDGQLGGIVLVGGVFSDGVVSDQTYVYYYGYWYPYWVYNLNMSLPPVTAFGAMPTDSADVAPILIGGLCGWNQTGLPGPNVSGYACTDDSYVFEIPPEPFITVLSPNPTDVGVSVTISAYNTIDSGSGPNMTAILLTGDGGYGVQYNLSVNFTENLTIDFSHAFTAPGTLIVLVGEEDFYDEVGLEYLYETVNENVSVAPAASPAVTELDQAGQAEVNFTSNPAFGEAPYTFAWTFGASAASSILENPVYDYTKAGTFKVNVTVTDRFGETYTASFSEVVYATLTADGSSNATTGADVGLAVSFTGVTTGGSGGNTYAWNVGAGHKFTTLDGAATYSTAGTYTVYFNITDNLGFKVSGHFTQVVNPVISAAPTESSSTPNTKTSVGFTAGVTGGTAPYTYAWNFGDSSTSTSENPSHTFSSAGTYTITLTVTDAFHQKVTKTLSVTVSTAPATSPLAGLTSGTGLYALIGIIVVVIIVIAAIAMLMRRRKGGAQSQPPAQWNAGASGPGTPPAGAQSPPPATPPAGSTNPPPPTGGS